MKYFLISLILLVSTIAFSQNFEIYGSIKDTTGSVKYSLYDVDENGTWKEVDLNVAVQNNYELSLKPDTYLIVFKNKDKAKHLYLDLDPELSGSYTMHVNFNLDTHGVVHFSSEHQKYVSYLVDNETILAMYKD